MAAAALKRSLSVGSLKAKATGKSPREKAEEEESSSSSSDNKSTRSFVTQLAAAPPPDPYPPAPHKNYGYHFFEYSHVNGSISLGRPVSMPYGPLAKTYACAKKPVEANRIRKVLQDAKFAPGRLIQLANAERLFVCQGAEVVRWVAVESLIPRVLSKVVILNDSKERDKPISQQECFLCTKTVRYGIYCNGCQKGACSECDPLIYRPYRPPMEMNSSLATFRPDSDYHIRMFVIDRCDRCVPIW